MSRTLFLTFLLTFVALAPFACASAPSAPPVSMLPGAGAVFLRPTDGAVLFEWRPTSDGNAAAAVSPSGALELFGDAAPARRLVSCRAGQRGYPIEACEDAVTESLWKTLEEPR